MIRELFIHLLCLAVILTPAMPLPAPADTGSKDEPLWADWRSQSTSATNEASCLKNFEQTYKKTQKVLEALSCADPHRSNKECQRDLGLTPLLGAGLLARKMSDKAGNLVNPSSTCSMSGHDFFSQARKFAWVSLVLPKAQASKACDATALGARTRLQKVVQEGIDGFDKNIQAQLEEINDLVAKAPVQRATSNVTSQTVQQALIATAFIETEQRKKLIESHPTLKNRQDSLNDIRARVARGEASPTLVNSHEKRLANVLANVLADDSNNQLSSEQRATIKRLKSVQQARQGFITALSETDAGRRSQLVQSELRRLEQANVIPKTAASPSRSEIARGAANEMVEKYRSSLKTWERARQALSQDPTNPKLRAAERDAASDFAAVKSRRHEVFDRISQLELPQEMREHYGKIIAMESHLRDLESRRAQYAAVSSDLALHGRQTDVYKIAEITDHLANVGAPTEAVATQIQTDARFLHNQLSAAESKEAVNVARGAQRNMSQVPVHLRNNSSTMARVAKKAWNGRTKVVGIMGRTAAAGAVAMTALSAMEGPALAAELMVTPMNNTPCEESGFHPFLNYHQPKGRCVAAMELSPKSIDFLGLPPADMEDGIRKYPEMCEFIDTQYKALLPEWKATCSTEAPNTWTATREDGLVYTITSSGTGEIRAIRASSSRRGRARKLIAPHGFMVNDGKITSFRYPQDRHLRGDTKSWQKAVTLQPGYFNEIAASDFGKDKGSIQAKAEAYRHEFLNSRSRIIEMASCCQGSVPSPTAADCAEYGVELPEVDRETPTRVRHRGNDKKSVQ